MHPAEGGSEMSEFYDLLRFNQDVLVCPQCGFEFLHHYLIETFERDEDDNKGLHTIIEGEKFGLRNNTAITTTYDNLLGNPSARRHGLRIGFICENGGHEFFLTIAQHKGQTVVHWEREKEL